MQCGAIALCFLVSSWLTQHGYDAAHRDAVLSYIQRESGFQPDVIERTGACLAQWAGIRRRRILALGNGRCPDWRAQVEFADAELRGPFAGFWRCSDPHAHMRQYFGKGTIDP